ncbi:hypothetical protein DF054_23795 [Burkholderia cepacia]|nr:hypothetical protein DF054_23795 [Burkholderia cepacia]
MAERLRCRPGDLAIVTRCGVPARIGLLVRVVERCRDSEHDWIAEIQGPGVFARGVDSGHPMLRKRALLWDWNLTPIRGEPLADDESVSRIMPAPVDG